jgi:hypothetical protein
MNEDLLLSKMEKVLMADKILHEQQLGLYWCEHCTARPLSVAAARSDHSGALRRLPRNTAQTQTQAAGLATVACGIHWPFGGSGRSAVVSAGHDGGRIVRLGFSF